jgi:phosphohistidine phosphatase
MKRLILIRHAKAESAELTPTPDRERMLTERGRCDAERLGAWLAEHIPTVDAIVASLARRTLETARYIAAGWSTSAPPIIEEPTLYLPTLEEIRAVVETLSPEWRSVALVGHNPSISDLRDALVGYPSEPMPTCAAVVLELPDTSWLDVFHRRWKLAHTWSPKERS